MAKHPADECQKACHSLVAICEHDPAVSHEKGGRMLLTIQRGRYFRDQLLNPETEAALAKNPDLLLFESVTEVDEVVGKVLDLAPREVMISPSCVKSTGRKITIKDFPDGFSFGNGVTVGSTVPIKNSEPCVLSWVAFPDSGIPAVQAAYDALKAIMEE